LLRADQMPSQTGPITQEQYYKQYVKVQVILEKHNSIIWKVRHACSGKIYQLREFMMNEHDIQKALHEINTIK